MDFQMVSHNSLRIVCLIKSDFISILKDNSWRTGKAGVCLVPLSLYLFLS
jgi:hypothetical protein